MTDSRSKDEFLESWRRAMDPGYTQPLEEERDGLGVIPIAAMARVFERVSISVRRTSQALYLKPHSDQDDVPASGATQATGTITIDRAAPTYGPIEIFEGDRLIATHTTVDGLTIFGVEIEAAADLSIADGDSGPFSLAVRAVRAGYQGNLREETAVVFEPVTVASIADAEVIVSAAGANQIQHVGPPDTFTEDMTGRYLRFVDGLNISAYPRRITSVSGNVAVVDGPALTLDTSNMQVIGLDGLGLTATLDVDMVGGAHGWLDVLGSERRVGRVAFEPDESYRERICALPDVVSPNALRRAAGRILNPYGIPFAIKEVRDPRGLIGVFWDVHPFDFGDLDNGQVLMGGCFARRGFVICVEYSGLGEFGAAISPPAASPDADDNAWDWLFFDGYPVGFWRLLLTLIAEIENTRGAGICWAIALVDSI